MLGITIKWDKEFSYDEEASKFTAELRIYIPVDEDGCIDHEFRSTKELLREKLTDSWGYRREECRCRTICFSNDNLDILKDALDRELVSAVILITGIVEDNRTRLHEAQIWSTNGTIQL